MVQAIPLQCLIGCMNIKRNLKDIYKIQHRDDMGCGEVPHQYHATCCTISDQARGSNGLGLIERC
jgi:hypothetical protein